MSQEKRRYGPGRTLIGCLLGYLLAVISPVMLATELTSLLPVLQLPSIGMLLILCYCGRGASVCTGMLLVFFTARRLGATFAWVMLLASVLPLSYLIRKSARPYFEQMKHAVIAYTLGMVAAVALLYISYGGSLIERALMLLPRAARSLPMEAAGGLSEIFRASGVFAGGVDFLDYFENLIASMVPVYEMNLPGLLFGGAILTGVLNVWIIGRVRKSRLKEIGDLYVPLKDWSLPYSTSIGVLLMWGTAYILYAADYAYGQPMYYAVYHIALVVFCIQAFASFARHWERKGTGVKIAICVAVPVLCLSGMTILLALYGSASAIFGRRGAIRSYAAEREQNDKDEE